MDPVGLELWASVGPGEEEESSVYSFGKMEECRGEAGVQPPHQQKHAPPLPPTLHSLFSVDMGMGDGRHRGPGDRGWTRGH